MDHAVIEQVAAASAHSGRGMQLVSSSARTTPNANTSTGVPYARQQYTSGAM